MSKPPGSPFARLVQARQLRHDFDKEDYDAFVADPEPAAKVSAVIAEFGADRRVYEVVFQVWGNDG